MTALKKLTKLAEKNYKKTRTKAKFKRVRAIMRECAKKNFKGCDKALMAIKEALK